MGQEDRETSQPEEHPKAQDQQSITVFTFCRTYWITRLGPQQQSQHGWRGVSPDQQEHQ